MLILFALLVLIFRLQGHRDQMMIARDELPLRDLAQAQRQILLLENDFSFQPSQAADDIRLKAELVQSRINLLETEDVRRIFPEDLDGLLSQASELWASARQDVDQWLTNPQDGALSNSISSQLTELELKFNDIFSQTNFYGLNLNVEAENANQQLIWLGVAFALALALLGGLFSLTIGRLADIQMLSLVEKESISRFPEQNPNPVMRFDADFKLIYGNSASKQLEQLFGLKEGKITRAQYRDWLGRIFASGGLIQAEGKVGQRVFRMVGSLVKDEQVINIYSFDVTEIKEAEMQVRHQLERLKALHTIDLAIASSEARDDRLKVVLEQTCQQLGMDAASIFLKSGNKELACVNSCGFRSSNVNNAIVPMGTSLVGRVAAERKVISIPDLAQSEYEMAPELTEEDGFQSYFAAPLIVRGELLGVMETLSRKPFSPPEDWIEFFNTLAGQAAIAVDNAHLFEELVQSNIDLSTAYDTTLEGWAKALELRDEQTEGHSRRVTDTTMLIAKELNIPEEQWEDVRRGAILHDIGKMGVPDSILLKQGPLTDDEWKVMKRHTEYAYEMLLPIAYLHNSLEIPRYHHEKWDGSGYNFGLKGEEIPLPARIFAIADVWDALRADRPYRKGLSEAEAWEIIQRGRGTHFDPSVMDAFEKVVIRPILGQSNSQD